MRFLHSNDGLLYPEAMRVTAGGDEDGALCSEGGQRTSIEFLRDAGDLPPLWVDDSELTMNGEAYMETNMTLNCSCADCSGSFTLTYDGETTGALDHDAVASDAGASR